MYQNTILLPLLFQVVLTFTLMLWMGVARVGAANRREVRLRDIALGQKAWPARVQAISNSYASQFELPLLFYLVVVLMLLNGEVSGFQISLAWAFVLLRLGHVATYVTSNNLRWRLGVFTLGALVLMLMWGLFAAQTYMKGA